MKKPQATRVKFSELAPSIDWKTPKRDYSYALSAFFLAVAVAALWWRG